MGQGTMNKPGLTTVIAIASDAEACCGNHGRTGGSRFNAIGQLQTQQ